MHWILKIHGLFIIDVIDTAKTVYEFSGAGSGTVLPENVQFTDETGAVFVVEQPIFRAWRKRYVGGPQEDKTEPISDADRRKLQQVVDELYGKLDYEKTSWYSGHWKFTPGVNSPQTLPIYQKVSPWEDGYEMFEMGVHRRKIGYVDESGEHYYDIPQEEFEGICRDTMS